MSALLTAAQIARLLDARLRALRVRAVGGETWAVTRRSGDGISGPVVGSSVGAVTGLLAPVTQRGVAVTLAAAVAPASTWQFVRTGGVTLQAGDELTGAGGVTCRIGPPAALAIGETWEASRP